MIESCRGNAAKQRLCADYHIELVTRMMRYNGQSIDGCCGAITTEYFIFKATHRAEPRRIETIVVGGRCGRAFLLLIGEKLPRMFNALPFSPSPSTSSARPPSPQSRTADAVPTVNVSEPLTPLNEQLYNAIHLLVSVWGGECKGLLADTLIRLRQEPTRDTPAWVIQSFNRIVGKDRRKRSLTAMAAQLRANNPGLHYYKFDLLTPHLGDETSHF